MILLQSLVSIPRLWTLQVSTQTHCSQAFGCWLRTHSARVAAPKPVAPPSLSLQQGPAMSKCAHCVCTRMAGAALGISTDRD